jgi:hypothetical protein
MEREFQHFYWMADFIQQPRENFPTPTCFKCGVNLCSDRESLRPHDCSAPVKIYSYGHLATIETHFRDAHFTPGLRTCADCVLEGRNSPFKIQGEGDLKHPRRSWVPLVRHLDREHPKPTVETLCPLVQPFTQLHGRSEVCIDFL